MSYNAPNPYVEKVPYKGNTPTINSNSIMGMIGITPNGDTTQAVPVASWSEFIEKFALGVDSPFILNSTLVHAVYGFFQNGGSLLYIARVVSSSSAKASASTTEGIKFEAKNGGEWGNKISVKLSLYREGESEESTLYLIEVKYDNNTMEAFIVNNDTTSASYYKEVVNNQSSYINVTNTEGSISKASEVTFVGGTDDLTGITDDDYINALKLFDDVYNLACLGIPGQSTVDIIEALIEYTKDKPVLPVLDISEANKDADTAIAFVNANCKESDAVVYTPYLTIVDPNSTSKKTKNVSPVGHIMGVIARTIDTQGEWNAAAGTDAVINGVVGVATKFSEEDRGKLNNAGINVILTKPNYGTVIWGARSLSADPELKYESNLTLNHTLRRNISDAMQRFEFKNNGPSLWVDVTAEITGLLETKRLAGAFAGATPETCYYVKCDSTNNTQTTIDKGQVIVEVGYAANKPAEFIIVRIAHQISN